MTSGHISTSMEEAGPASAIGHGRQGISVYTILYYIMAGRAFVVARKNFIIEKVIFWKCEND